MARLPKGFSKRKDGRIQRQFVVAGKRYTVCGNCVKEVREKETLKRIEIEQGTFKRSSKITVSEYFERWMEAQEGTIKETTERTRRTLWRRIEKTTIDKAGHTFGELILSEVETENVRSLQRGLAKDVKTRTVNECISLVNGMYRTALAEHIIEWNPCLAVRRLKRTEPPARNTIHRALTSTEISTFLEVAKKQHSFYLPLYVFLLNTGCRVGEAGAVTEADISRGFVRIRRTITRSQNGGYLIGEDTKTAAGARHIPLNEDALQAIREQRRYMEMLTGALDISKPLFRSPRGTLLKSEGVNRDISKICKEAGIDYFSVHAFRDTFTTFAVFSGISVKELQEILGHADIKMTLGLYAHGNEERKTEQMKLLKFA